MKTKAFRIISILVLVLVLLVLGTAVAGAIAKSNLANQYSAPGQLVDVGGYKMHINCVGRGSPTVILEAGTGDFSLIWAYIQPEVAKDTRVCSYDRAGFGWSEASPHPRTGKNMVAELHTLLVKANIQGPFVLVGHSLGGLLARVYAHNYPDEVVGLVLVDSAHEEIDIRLPESAAKANLDLAGQLRMFALLSSTGIMALVPQYIPNPGLPEDAFAQYQAIMATTRGLETSTAEINAGEKSYAEMRALHMTSFGNIPLIVLSRGHWDVISLLSDADNQQSWEVWQEVQSELAALSPGAKQIIAEQSGHYIQLDQPDLVIEAIREIVDLTRK
jgi:pimeloyl-ACP methyl ester carboxylesterase